MMEVLDKQLLSLAGGKMGLIVALEKRQGKGIGMSVGGFGVIKAGVFSQPPIPGAFSPIPLHPGGGKEQEQDGSTRILPSHGFMDKTPGTSQPCCRVKGETAKQLRDLKLFLFLEIFGDDGKWHRAGGSSE